MKDTATLLVSCPDQKGLVAGISSFIYQNGGNILHADQHTDLQAGMFLARMEWELNGFQIPRESIAECFQPIARKFGLEFEVSLQRSIPKVAIFASKLPHCLHDLLLRHAAGELRAEIAVIISNHAETGAIAASYGVPFRHIPLGRENKAQAEAAEFEELDARGIDLIVLARYMQILSNDFVARYPKRIINIHHSFLPAFIGAQPYHQAFSRGVKLIGATSHYVTSDLDEGPIIEQEVMRVSHRDCVEDLIRKGRDLEKVVLGRAVRLHLANRVLTYGNKTVIFD
jgi:formyltetrahydrofolate deformylase